MSVQFSIPLALAIFALIISDETNILLKKIYSIGISIGDRTQVEAKLAQLGKTKSADFENFRISQMAFIAAPLVLSTMGYFLNIYGLAFYLSTWLLIPLAAIALTNRDLNQRVSKRKRDIEGEFPAIVEMLTLAVGAGESPAGAIKRITRRAEGHIADEFLRVVREVESGVSFSTALDGMSRRIDSLSLRRFVDSLIISISRGTPLVETLTHGVNESRNQERVRLLAAAGKSEISMMIPVVFLILPVSILFALYPSLANLNLFAS
jgi:tight adherence protein C